MSLLLPSFLSLLLTEGSLAKEKHSFADSPPKHHKAEWGWAGFET